MMLADKSCLALDYSCWAVASPEDLRGQHGTAFVDRANLSAPLDFKGQSSDLASLLVEE